MSALRIFIGYDSTEDDAWQVAAWSLQRQSRRDLDIRPLQLDELRRAGLYTREHVRKDGQLWDGLHQQPMTTEFSFSRYLLPAVAGWRGWALFCDCDFLFRADVAELFALADERFAVMCVKHQYVPGEAVKMEGLVQEAYDRKNWSSLMLWNCAHHAHWDLVHHANRWPKYDLHRLSWLADELIGELPVEWNWLAGVSAASVEPKAVHFTLGLPRMAGYENCAYADQWREELAHASRQAPA